MKNALNTFFCILLSCVIISCASVKNENTDNKSNSGSQIRNTLKNDSSALKSESGLTISDMDENSPDILFLPNQTKWFYFKNSADSDFNEEMAVFLKAAGNLIKKNPNSYIAISSIAYAPDGGSIEIANKRISNATIILLTQGISISQIRGSAYAYSDKNFDKSADKSKLNNIQITIVSN